MASVSHDAFVDALCTGDVAVLDAYFAQPHVRASVAETELSILERRQRGDTLYIDPYTLRNFDDWYIISTARDFHLRCVFNVPVVYDQLDALRWFFSSENLSLMPVTLAWVLPHMIITAADEGAMEMLELLLAAEVAGSLLTPQKLQEVLDTALHWSNSHRADEVLNTLVSHGADVNADTEQGSALGNYIKSGKKNFNMLVANGLVIVGEDVARYCTLSPLLESTRQALRSGAHYTNDSEYCGVRWQRLNDNGRESYSGGLLHHAVVSGDLLQVQLMLEEGFVDVDKRNCEGETALMMVAWKKTQRTARNGSPADMARLLLDYGADVTPADDFYRRTVLHHTVGTEHTDVVRMLLESGANPNATTTFGVSILDMLALPTSREDSNIVDQALLLLKHGLNPFINGNLQLLEGIEAAKAYIEEHHSEYHGELGDKRV